MIEGLASEYADVAATVEHHITFVNGLIASAVDVEFLFGEIEREDVLGALRDPPAAFRRIPQLIPRRIGLHEFAARQDAILRVFEAFHMVRGGEGLVQRTDDLPARGVKRE